MESFTEPKDVVENPHYQEQRQETLSGLSDKMIDVPIIEVINTFNKLPYCFTIQSCYGHFVYNGQRDPHNLEPLPAVNTIARVEYKIAYIAFCIDNNYSGRSLLGALNKISSIDPENIQLCSAEWFWKRQVNSYALQVEPDRFKYQDRAEFDYKEALNLENTRKLFFIEVMQLLQTYVPKIKIANKCNDNSNIKNSRKS